MGHARRNWMQGIVQRKAARIKANETKGVPIPGTGVSHYHKHSSGSNKSRSLNKLNGEWSPEGRKEEDALRGINNHARQQNIAEQVAEIFEEEFAPFSEYRPEDNWEDELVYIPHVTLNGRAMADFDDDYADVYREDDE